jgi:HlyD family secretion protein
VDSFPGRTFQGTVGQVRKAALVVQNVVTYTAVIATSNPNLDLFPGMTANVRIVVDTRENALKVPNAALRFRPAGTAESRGGDGARDPVGAPAPAEETSKGGRGPSADAVRERLTQALNLSVEQQARLEEILRDTRDRIRSLETGDTEERRRQSERLRSESRSRIAEMLNPEQRVRYEQMNAGRAAGGRTASSGRVWVMDDTGKLMSVNVRLGLADGTHTEVIGGALQEGSRVIVGTQADKAARAQPKGGPRFGL